MAPRRPHDLVPQIVTRLKPQAKSLIITIYGDSVSAHGGCAWLGSVIRLAGPLGLNERAVRTSIFRLAKEGWLSAEQIGRRSYYRLTESGWRRCDAAHVRIYFPPAQSWDGRWTVVSIGHAGIEPDKRDALRAELRWLGFGQLASGILIHPSPDEAALRQAIYDAGVSRQVLVMRAETESWVAPEAVRETLRASWDLERVAHGYAEFLDIFRPVWQALNGGGRPDPQTGFAIRTLLMHAFRRVLLRDPKLPDELLEADWPGTAARQLCRNLYKLVEQPAEQHLLAELETAEGTAPDAHPSYFSRFGGLYGPSGERAPSAP
ncbi:MAG: phenylacetic acid degradation operon negative regulatory protein PaaX [Xanthobacteraceae bacterium]|nr:MAG: phenylacetic acid degradation operon negative regulatory protein PaaX [Xanthobacteraceae bacterium]